MIYQLIMNLLVTIPFLIIANTMVAQNNSWNTLEKNGMRFEWKIEGKHLRCKVEAPTTGWVAVGFNTQEMLKGTNLIMASVEQDFYRVDDRYIVAPGNHQSMETLGMNDQIFDRYGEEHSGKTFIHFAIPLKADDAYHLNLVIGQQYHLLMAYSLEDDFQHHSIMRTSTTIKL